MPINSKKTVITIVLSVCFLIFLSLLSHSQPGQNTPNYNTWDLEIQQIDAKQKIDLKKNIAPEDKKVELKYVNENDEPLKGESIKEEGRLLDGSFFTARIDVESRKVIFRGKPRKPGRSKVAIAAFDGNKITGKYRFDVSKYIITANPDTVSFYSDETEIMYLKIEPKEITNQINWRFLEGGETEKDINTGFFAAEIDNASEKIEFPQEYKEYSGRVTFSGNSDKEGGESAITIAAVDNANKTLVQKKIGVTVPREYTLISKIAKVFGQLKSSDKTVSQIIKGGNVMLCLLILLGAGIFLSLVKFTQLWQLKGYLIVPAVVAVVIITSPLKFFHLLGLKWWLALVVAIVAVVLLVIRFCAKKKLRTTNLNLPSQIIEKLEGNPEVLPDLLERWRANNGSNPNEAGTKNEADNILENLKSNEEKNPIVPVIIAGIEAIVNVEKSTTISQEYQENKISEEMEKAMDKQKEDLSKWTRFIEACNVLAPLFGFLGTIIGLILAFNDWMAVAKAGEENIRVEDLAGGMSQAMITTQWGLIVAIAVSIPLAIILWRIRKISSVMSDSKNRMLKILTNPVVSSISHSAAGLTHQKKK